ncbi:MAG: tetratricopeptide repeat protein [Vibrionaceae bacterium]
MIRRFIFLSLLLINSQAAAAPMAAVPIYDEAQLIRLFENNRHLQKVAKEDDCQLLQDIEARAIRIEMPAYQFLYGDMLAWGICIEKDVEQGLYYMQQSAAQGLPAALEQLGRYYANGILVQQDKERAVLYMREAALLGNVRAKVQLAELLLTDNGSPLDYEDAYRWLYSTATADKTLHKKIAQLRKKLEARMPAYVVRRAKQRISYW